MDKFLVLSTIADQNLANKTCAMLEEAKIPVMLEHVVIEENGISACGFRVLVPPSYTQTASALIEKASVIHYAKLNGSAARNELV